MVRGADDGPKTDWVWLVTTLGWRWW